MFLEAGWEDCILGEGSTLYNTQQPQPSQGVTSGAVTVVHVQIVQNCEAFLLFNSAAVSVCKIYSTVKHKSNF